MQKTGKNRKTIFGMRKQLLGRNLPESIVEIFIPDYRLNIRFCLVLDFNQVNLPGHHEFLIFNPFKTE